ncbi:UNVERIFIED_CONTAM: putative sugar phosphate/phosphate translocator [Sesamum latifolium]|uniref:Sugar phosphate/phosphate translocator n=1 Tax=Sesamum latifolium TaxID=2727402 RepID=A0AAW2UIM0_9LAMI
MADPNRKWLRQEFATYAYILLYIALSSNQIFFNKWVLSSKEINFPYPLRLTLLHMVFSSVLCFMLTKVLKIMKVEEGMTRDIYRSSVVPIGAMFAMTLWLGNTTYLYVSVAFAQMLKAIILALLMFTLGDICRASCCFHSWSISWTRSDELQDASDNVGYQFWGTGSILWGNKYKLDWCRLPNGRCSWRSFTANIYGDFLKRKGLKLNPISVMYYVSPCRQAV